MTLEISWDTEDTALLPGGGEAIRTTEQILDLDIVDSDTYRVSAKISAHAVERGVDVTDHTEPEQDRVQVQAAISQRPMSVLQVDGSTTLATLPNGKQAVAVVPPEGTERKSDAFEELRELNRTGTLVNVDGLIRPLEDYQIESISSPRKVETAGLLVVDMVFVEHRTAEVEEVDAPAPRTERGRNGTDRGRESGDGDNDEEASGEPGERTSALQAIGNALRGTNQGVGAGE